MPYIHPDERPQYDDYTATLNPSSAGHLNYVLTCILDNYLGKNPNYQKFCDCEGVLGHASKELYRRRTSDYEDQKIKENGDVY